MARDRSDLRWQHCEEAWQRLMWARETAGFKSAAAFARKVSENEHTYKAYERDQDSGSKSIKLTFPKARAWAPVLGVRWEWLLNGEGLPWLEDEPSPGPVAEINRIVGQQPPEEQERLLDLVKLWTRTG